MKTINRLTIIKYCALVPLMAFTSLAANAQVVSQACGPLNTVTHPTTNVPTTVPNCKNTNKSYTFCEKPELTTPVCLDLTKTSAYDSNQLSDMTTKINETVTAQRDFIAKLQSYNSCLIKNCAAIAGHFKYMETVYKDPIMNFAWKSYLARIGDRPPEWLATIELMKEECNKLKPPITATAQQPFDIETFMSNQR